MGGQYEKMDRDHVFNNSDIDGLLLRRCAQGGKIREDYPLDK